MIGSSSTWYAMSARFKSSRSSAARAAGSDFGKQLLRGVDDRVGVLALEPRAVVDTGPCDRDRAHPCRLRRADVERGVAHVGGVLRVDAHPLRREQPRLGVGTVAAGLVG